ncbi:MAG: hypothetical protein LUO89_14990 [Methanothrix sp.]|nr:hypothetical protein [Methanothrix sp.]
MQIRQYVCNDERRKLEIARDEKLTGIDYLEVSKDQRKLYIYFIPSLVEGKEPIPEGINILNIRIAGGSKITNVRAEKVEDHLPGENKLTVCVKDDISSSGVGDFSTYTLKLVNLENADPIFSKIDFSFKVNCPNDSDCRAEEAVCRKEKGREIRLDYLTRDYSGFRRLILDRLSEIMPNLKESSVSDLGVVIAEIMAYAADYLAYYQDAVATEAYLGTARRRISIRRHARLLDYYLNDGCNARVWLTAEVQPGSIADGKPFPIEKGDCVFSLKKIPGKGDISLKKFLTKTFSIGLRKNPNIEQADNAERVEISTEKNPTLVKFDEEKSEAKLIYGNKTIKLIAEMENDELKLYEIKKVEFLTKVERFKYKTFLSGVDEYNEAISLGAQVFEPINSIILHSSQNEMLFYTWGEEDCCLPKNATKATLVVGGETDGYPAVGDVLIFEESVREPEEESVREPEESLKKFSKKSIKESKEESEEEFGYLERRHAVRLTKVEPVDDKLIDYVKIYRSKKAYEQFADKKIQLINIEWCAEDALPFPLCISRASQTTCSARGNVLLADHGRSLDEDLDKPEANKRYRPKLKNKPLTYQAYLKSELFNKKKSDGELIAACEIISENGTGVYPVIELSEVSTDRKWSPQRDLINCGRFDRAFVAEIDDDGFAVLRFGDGMNGMKPFGDFKAKYRVGNGSIGNVGSDSIGHIFIKDEDPQDIIKIRNPMHAEGGKDQETVNHARLFAPQALHEKEYAVNEEDYAMMAEKYADVQKAVATLRWTGSWNTMFINVDLKAGRSLDASFKKELLSYLNRFCLAGFDLEVEGPTYVPLDIALNVVVNPEDFSARVMENLQEEFSCQKLSDGRDGFFYPDQFTFGKSVYLSRLVARAIQIPGVLRVEVIRFQRKGKVANGELAAGEIKMGRLEIARLDSDPNSPENGMIEFNMEGGR